MIVHHPVAGADERPLGRFGPSLPARHLAREVTLFQASAAKRITLHLHNQVPPAAPQSDRKIA